LFNPLLPAWFFLLFIFTSAPPGKWKFIWHGSTYVTISTSHQRPYIRKRSALFLCSFLQWQQKCWFSLFSMFSLNHVTPRSWSDSSLGPLRSSWLLYNTILNLHSWLLPLFLWQVELGSASSNSQLFKWPFSEHEDASKPTSGDPYVHSVCMACQHWRMEWVSSLLDAAVIISGWTNLRNSVKFLVCKLIAHGGEWELSHPLVAFSALMWSPGITKQKVSWWCPYRAWSRWRWVNHSFIPPISAKKQRSWHFSPTVSP
jgi:hypothetical protein